MTPKKVAEGMDNRILAFLQTLATHLAARHIVTNPPIHLWDHENEFYEWWLLVFPYRRLTTPPDNAINVEIRLRVTDDGWFGRIICQLETVEGVMLSHIWDTYDNIRMDTADISEFEAEFERLEDPATVRNVVEKLEGFIKRARKRQPMGPRDWSPRLEGSKKKKEAGVAVNIVEDKRWKDNWSWDSGEFERRVQGFSDSYYQTMKQEPDACESLIEDILGKYYKSDVDEGPREWTPRAKKVVGPEGVKKACGGLHDGSLEEVSGLIGQVVQFMYEDALSPHEGDISYALDETKEYFLEKPDLDYEIWDPLIDKLMEGKKGDWSSRLRAAKRSIMLGLLNKIQYTGEEKHHEYYIEFDLMGAQEVVDLIHAWPVEDRAWVEDALRFHEFKAFQNEFMSRFFEELKKDMDEGDPENRTDWRGHWQAKDQAQVEVARKEIFEYLKTAPELPEDE